MRKVFKAREEWGPIVMDVEFECPTCKKLVRARLTTYSDAAYVTCNPAKHHFSYNNPGQVPGLVGHINTRLRDEASDAKPDDNIPGIEGRRTTKKR